VRVFDGISLQRKVTKPPGSSVVATNCRRPKLLSRVLKAKVRDWLGAVEVVLALTDDCTMVSGNGCFWALNSAARTARAMESNVPRCHSASGTEATCRPKPPVEVCHLGEQRPAAAMR
jgi:hypothetical protein